MVLTIHDKNGNPRAELSANDSSTQAKEIQGDNVLTLSFTLYDHIDLDVDDYVDFEGERYWSTERYRPKQVSTKEWKYDLKLYGIESLVGNILVIKRVDGENDPVFSLTAPPAEHVAMIVNCLNEGWGGVSDWKVGQVDGVENITVDYHGKYCDEALKEIAEIVGAEWWVEGQTVNVCRCEHGEPITLGYDAGLTSIEPDKADNVKFYTRLWPVGSSRNIDPEKYGFSRLQLPGGRKYVEVNADKYGRVDHYEADAFADIYPRRTGVVSAVRSETRKGEDGEDFTIYYFKDDDLPFNPDDYMIGGKVLRVSFQEGSELAGLGDEEDGTYYFEANFDSSTGEFEIITIWPYNDGTQLPGGVFVPKAGDRYIVWNLRMPDEYYALAEAEFLAAVDKYNDDHALDVSVFKAPTDHVWVEDEHADLYVGRRVRLLSDRYFPETGYRDSRITKITRKVNLPSQMDLEIGDALSRTARQKMTDDIAGAKSYAESIAGSVRLPDIIRTGDRTSPTDNNLFSARRALQEALSKKNDDRALGKIDFAKGLTAGGGKAEVTEQGNATFNTAASDTVGSKVFVDGLTGAGFRCWIDENGVAHIEADRLSVRQTMAVYEFLIRRVKSIGGEFYASAADGKIKSVVAINDSYIIAFDGGNQYEVGDLLRFQRWDTIRGKNKFYWARVGGVNRSGVIVAKSEFDDGVVPEIGDETVLMGSSNPDRQGCVLLSATDDGRPRVDVLSGISSKSLAGCLRARLGCLDGIQDPAFPADAQPSGYGLYVDNAYLKGHFVLSSGKDVQQLFAILDGRLTSAIEGLRDVRPTDGGVVSNPMFADGGAKWSSTLGTVFTEDESGVRFAKLNSGGTASASLSQPQDNQDREKLLHYPDLEVGETFAARMTVVWRSKAEGKLTARCGAYPFGEISVGANGSDGQWRTWVSNGRWDGFGPINITATMEVDIAAVEVTDDMADYFKSAIEQTKEEVKIYARKQASDMGDTLRGEISVKADEIKASVAEDVGGRLRETGIDIVKRKITIQADTTTFVDSEGNTQAFIEDGKINADALDVDDLTARRVEVVNDNNDKQKITIDPATGDMQITDASGNVTQRFTGQRRTGDFFSQSGANDNFATTNRSKTLSKTADGMALQPTFTPLSAAVNLASPTKVEVTAATVRVTASAGSFSETIEQEAGGATPYPREAMASAEAAIVISVYDRDPATAGATRQSTLVVGETAKVSAQTTLASFSDISAGGAQTPTYQAAHAGSGERSKAVEVAGTRMVQGWARLEMRTSLSIRNLGKSSCSAKAAWGTAAAGGNAVTAKWTAEEQHSEFFSNGFLLGKSAADYVLVYNDGAGMNLEAVTDKYGLRVNRSGMLGKVGDAWGFVPVVVFAAYIGYDSSTSTYSVRSGRTASGLAAPTISRPQAGRCLLQFPTWQAAMGGSDRFSATTMIVDVTTNNADRKASTYTRGASQVGVSLGADADFLITISVI